MEKDSLLKAQQCSTLILTLVFQIINQCQQDCSLPKQRRNIARINLKMSSKFKNELAFLNFLLTCLRIMGLLRGFYIKYASKHPAVEISML